MNFIDPFAKIMGSWSYGINAASIILRIAVSIIFAAVLGCERSGKRHAAGLRTFILVALSASVSIIIDMTLMENYGVALPFLSGAAVIAMAIISCNTILYSSRSQIKGLTTSAALWACGTLGFCIGAGYYLISLIVFAALMCCLAIFPKMEAYLKNRSNHFEIHLELNDIKYLQNFVITIRQLGLTIDDIESNPAYLNSGLSVYSVAVSINSDELKKYKTHKEIIKALSTLEYINHIEEMN